MSSTTSPVRRASPPLIRMPWMNKRGGVCPLRLPTLFLVMVPAAILAVQWRFGLLGPEPDKALMREIGEWTLRLLLMTLAVTPLSVLADTPKVIYVRRLMGVATCCYGVAHLLYYIVYNNFDLPKVATEIALRFYLTIGFVALVGMLVLAWTSNDPWVRRLGKNWKRLHRLIYPITALAVLHFFIQAKADVSEPVFISGLFAWLLTYRALPDTWQRHWAMPLLLVPVAGLGAALFEYLWYALATNFPAGQVLAANLDLSFGPRPAVWSAIAAAALATFSIALRHGGTVIGRLRQA